VVPCGFVSGKQEYGAYTIRPKIHRVLDGFLDEFDTLKKHKYSWKGPIPDNQWKPAFEEEGISRFPPYVRSPAPGENAAWKALKKFISNGLGSYHLARNDPNAGATSGLSPYLHFGQLSAQRVALEVRASDAPQEAKEAFLEELVVRRELSDNFCWHNDRYDTLECYYPGWAKTSLEKHRNDPREFLYSPEQFEEAVTHDPLWNAAQMQMVKTGTMHGYMRMYWGRKILEWSPSPQKAVEVAIYLDDKYRLDGRDPNGYTGIAWCIGGVRDRAWKERPVFGKIRYMSESGCRRKFDVDAYINKINDLL